MGQAKKRGTFGQRQAEAIERSSPMISYLRQARADAGKEQTDLHSRQMIAFMSSVASGRFRRKPR